MNHGLEPAPVTNEWDVSPSFVPTFAPLDLTTLCNTSEDEILANVRHNSRRELPWLKAVPPHEGIAVLVGGGPSLPDTLEAIQILAAQGATIFALNGSEKWLLEHAIATDHHFVIDPRPSNLKFLEGSRASSFYINSQCNPVLFDYLTGRKVTVCHMADDVIQEIIFGMRPDAIMIGGGITIGFTAMSLAMALGYRTMHLFGYDSSDREGDAHAYAQSEDGAESERMEVWVAGKMFRGQPAFVSQAYAFPRWASILMRHGAAIHVHGSGLLPTVALEMQKPIEPDAACYDMAMSPASWDFAPWLMGAEMNRRRLGGKAPLRVAFMNGPGEGGFRIDTLPVTSVDIKTALRDKVMRPLLALVGAVEDQSAYGGYTSHSYILKIVTDAARAGEEVPKFVPMEADLAWVDGWLGNAPAPITITLRETEYHTMRNSNMSAWLEFASRRQADGENVVFVRDTARADEELTPFLTCPHAAKDVGIRAALYHRAKVNLFVSNGPIALAYFGSAPFLIFKEVVDGSFSTEHAWRNQIGLEVGEQYPWCDPYQRLTWSDDTIENIEAAWHQLVADMSDVSLAAE